MSEEVSAEDGELCWLPLCDLVKSELNMRKHPTVDKQSDKELRASIKAHGVLQNLIVHPVEKGRGRNKRTVFGVAGGDRRLTQLLELAKEKEIDPATYLVPCVVKADKARALAASVAENANRQDAHPVDEFKAFKRLVDEQGLDVKSIALEFGKSEKYVRQRLALAAVDDEILDAYLAGKVQGNTVSAFTVEPDTAKQREVFRRLKKDYRLNPFHVRHELISASITQHDGRVRYVTLKAYEAAGGAVTRDLFGDDVYLHDEKLLDQLVEAKMAKHLARLEKEGWKWVKVVSSYFHFDYDRHEPAYLDELEAEHTKLVDAWQAAEAAFDDAPLPHEDGFDEDKVEQLNASAEAARKELQAWKKKHASKRQFTDEQKASSGAIVELDHDGRLVTHRGIIRPEDREATSTDKSSRKKGSGQGDSTYSQAVRDDIRHHRQQAFKVTLFDYPELVMDLFHFTIIRNCLSSNYEYELFINIAPSHRTPNFIVGSRHDNEIADRQLKEIFDALPLDWTGGTTILERFQAYRELSAAAKHQLLMAAIIGSISIPLRGDNEFADAIIDDICVQFAALFQPTAENFFGRVSKSVMETAVKETFGDFPEDFNRSQRKGAMAKHLEQLFERGGPGHTAGWLPDGF